MSNAALLNRQDGGGAPADEMPAVMVPFVRASRERIELAYRDERAITSVGQPSSPISIPASGFMRHVVIEVEASGGAAGAATVAATQDGPFAAVSDLALADVNGNPIFGPVSGFQAYLAAKYGAYVGVPDARLLPSWQDVDEDGNFRFQLRVPVEISGRDGFGALANMNASQTYKLRYTLAAASEIYATAPETLPGITVSVWLDTWSPPRESDPNGIPQETRPPAHGSTQYWSSAVYNIGAGEQTLRLTRVGNLIRTLVFIVEGGAGRDSALWADPARLEYDGTLVETVGRVRYRDRMAEQWQLTGPADGPGGLDTGVYALSYHHDLDGIAGFEVRDGYMATSQATRLDLRGIFGAGTERVTVLTNDIAVPAGASATGTR